FQDYALFPHQDVFQNVAFGLEMQRWDRARVAARVQEMLELVGLTGYEHRRVFELSGGEQQRVALARSLAPQPQLLMLDEPIGSLDRALREQLLEELRHILRRVGVTTIYVTHDQQEAFALADRVAIMRDGRIVQEGSPEEVYRHPVDAFVARFLGLSNLLRGRVVADGRVETPIGVLAVPDASSIAPGTDVTVLIRPEAAVLPSTGQEPNLIRGRVLDRAFRGSQYRLRTTHAGDVVLEFDITLLDASLPGPGEEVTLSLSPAGLSILAPALREHTFSNP
ncbi:MAG: ABC transporter ATP-binding protein, partial [Anaerolineae bacterium]|nr:ABC transporter ATP-binding protein [Anaerolineae bacterium]